MKSAKLQVCIDSIIKAITARIDLIGTCFTHAKKWGSLGDEQRMGAEIQLGRTHLDIMLAMMTDLDNLIYQLENEVLNERDAKKRDELEHHIVDKKKELDAWHQRYKAAKDYVKNIKLEEPEDDPEDRPAPGTRP